MSQRPADPSRLRERRDQPDPVARIAGQAARDLAAPKVLSALSLAAIAEEIEARRSKPHGTPRLGWALVVGAFVLGIVTAASAAHLDFVPRWLSRVVHRQPKSPPQSFVSRPKGARAVAKVAEQNVVIPPTPAVAPPSPAAAPTLAPQPQPSADVDGRGEVVAKQPNEATPGSRAAGSVHRRDPSPAMPYQRPASPPKAAKASPYLAWSAPAPQVPVAAAERPHMDEVAPPAPALPTHVPTPPRPSPAVVPVPKAPAATPAKPASGSSSNPTAMHLKDIVRALRVEHSPRQAIELLDRHASELSNNSFADEALLLRVEAMMALGRSGAVLRLLDGASLTNVAASRVLLVTRGELRAAANRCAEGIGDFDLVLAEARRPSKQALLGRARCKDKLGDAAGAKADLDRYRREFPDDSVR